MNTNIPEPASRRNPVLRRWPAAQRDDLTPAPAAAASGLWRWIGAALQALTPAPIPTESAAPAGRPSREANGTPSDSRALPP